MTELSRSDVSRPDGGDRRDTVGGDPAACLIRLCVREGWHIACAESLTGGLLADAFVRVPGASRAFLGSAVTYHLGAKRHLLDVDGALLDHVGAVDARVARQMAEGRRSPMPRRCCRWTGRTVRGSFDDPRPVHHRSRRP